LSQESIILDLQDIKIKMLKELDYRRGIIDNFILINENLISKNQSLQDDISYNYSETTDMTLNKKIKNDQQQFHSNEIINRGK